MAGDISDIDIVQAGLQGEGPSAFQSGYRGRRQVFQTVQGMEAAEVERDLRPQFPGDPAAHRLNHGGLVVVGGNNQVDDLQMHFSSNQRFQGVQHRFQCPLGKVPGKIPPGIPLDRYRRHRGG